MYILMGCLAVFTCIFALCNVHIRPHINLSPQTLSYFYKTLKILFFGFCHMCNAKLLLIKSCHAVEQQNLLLLTIT